MNNKDIAIVGLGYVSSLGSGKETFYNKVDQNLPTTKMETYDPDGFLGKRGLRYFSKATKMYCNLAFQCINQNKVKNVVELSKERVGLYDGTELSNIEDGFVFDLVAKHDGPELVSPMSTPNTIANAAASQMAIQSKITGPNFSINGGTCSAIQAIDVASMHLKDGVVDCAIVCSTETISKYHEAIREGEKRKTKLPIANEYGASIALERVETALENGQEIYGVIAGVISGQTYKDQSRENLMATLIQELLNNNQFTVEDIDMIMVGSGAHNISGTTLSSEIASQLGETPSLFFPEMIYGNGDNAGGLASILYTTGLFNEQLKDVRGQFNDGEIQIDAVAATPKNVIVATIDKTGYAVLTLIRKYN
ncbi:beta-ketoacyl synthase N-terminal-like domain-containing protein [Pseudofulvibacter geojedonensis]|uniref:Beta-ketoacyl synthase N-terminal-like domain-containing protein n=1 Tax=Pseudofulvibacter geojedonensis TaxID=1123758 RepID=A0ABW3I0D3_9FLAO